VRLPFERHRHTCPRATFCSTPSLPGTPQVPCAPTLNAPPTETTRLSLSELCSEPRIGGPLTPSVTYLAKGDHSVDLGASVTPSSLGKAHRAASQPRRPKPSVAERAKALIRRRRRPPTGLPSAAVWPRRSSTSRGRTPSGKATTHRAEKPGRRCVQSSGRQIAGMVHGHWTHMHLRAPEQRGGSWSH